MRPPTVAVCVATRFRPEGLRRLLESLAALEQPPGGVVLLVADNDPAGSAAGTVEEVRGFADVRYEIESEPGVAATRNRLVSMARTAGVAYAAFVDDDEHVDRRWLVELLAAADAHAADAVIGPVLAEYPPGAPGWIVTGSYFERDRPATGVEVRRGNTGNCLIAMRLFDREPPFPPELASAEDTFFFLRAQRGGAKVVWCDEAVVFEAVGAERVQPRWLLRRAFAGGVGYSRCLVILRSSRLRLAARAATSVVRIVEGVVMFAPAAVRGRAGLLRAAMTVAAGAGGLRGLGRRRHG